MAIVPLTELLDFCDVGVWYFTIDASHDVLMLTSTGSAIGIDVSDGIYLGSYLASELQDRASSGLGSTGLTVAYSTGTKKFTITEASTGKTIAYTHKGSDAGLTFGFNQDHSAAYEIESDLAAGDPSAILESIRDSVEDWVEAHCHKTFESASYAKYYDGNGGQYLQLDDYPITALTRVAIGRRSAIRVKNTSDYTTASISVTSTGLVFVKDGGDPDTIDFTDENYNTMGEVVTAINDLVNGWSAVIESSDYNNFQSSELVEMFGKSAIEDNWVYLDIPNRAIDDFEVFPARGEIYRGMGWPEGNRNIFVEDTAGYSEDTMPKDLQLAVKIITKSIYDRRKDELFGTKEYWAGDVKVKCEDGDVPKEALSILSKFKRHLI
ncbi:hypothetical protein ES705_36581 [subsurface metagenome]